MRSRRPTWSLLAALLLLAPGSWGAEDAALSQARERFDQGLSLESAGNWAEALALFREVAKVRSTAAVRFHIARCLENLGRWNEALGAYELAMSEAEGRTKDEIVQLSTEASERLRRQIPTLRLLHAPGAEVVRVRLDGVEIGAAAFDRPLPLDPGGHELQLSDGELTAQHVVKLEPRQRQSFRVERLRPTPKPSVTASTGPSRSAMEPERSVGPWLLMGAGAASLAATGVFWGLAQGKESELRSACFSADLCPTSAKPIHDAGERYTLLANVTGVVGLLAIATGATWRVLQPAPPRKAHHERLELRVGAGAVVLGGKF